MFVLDTNVLSAMMSAAPVPQVAAWVSGQPAELLFTATICQAEILSGLSIMPEGRRRSDLEAAARAMFDLMIAAVARSQGASVVTRNVDDFEACGVGIVNPWDA
jgi:predicted nucleic acid-binding protein